MRSIHGAFFKQTKELTRNEDEDEVQGSFVPQLRSERSERCSRNRCSSHEINTVPYIVCQVFEGIP